MAARRHGKHWSRQELLLAMNLYLRLPFGLLHGRNPQIRDLATALGRTPSALAMKLVNLANLDPDCQQKGLSGTSAGDRSIWFDMQQDWLAFCEEMESAVEAFQATHSEPARGGVPGPLSGQSQTEEMREVRVRRGQNRFRQAVLAAYDWRCCVSGTRNRRLLIASHIIPWSEAPEKRLFPTNGLCLSALHDRAFDSGLITFDADFRLRLSSDLRNGDSQFERRALGRFEGCQLRLPERFRPDREALAYHRASVFRG